MPEDPRERIRYSQKYNDESYEYRWRYCFILNRSFGISVWPEFDLLVTLPKTIAQQIPQDRFLSESEWREIGVRQSPGWIHYMIHHPEPHILIFRRPLPSNGASPEEPTG